MSHVPRTNNYINGPRDSLEMSFAEYIPPPSSSSSANVLMKRKSLGLAPGLGRSTSELGASNDSAGTEKTAASSTRPTCAGGSKSLDRFGLARPRISVDTVSTSERSLSIDCITCEEALAVNVDDAHDDDDTSDRNKQERAPTESIMKYKTLEESIKHSYESSRRKHLKKQTQKKKKKRASMKRNRLSGTTLARMGRRVGSLPNMKRALGSVVRLGSTANVSSDSSGKVTEESTSAQTMPRGGETNANWASSPVPAAATSHTKESKGNIFLDMLKQQEEHQRSGVERAITPPLLGLHQPRPLNNTSNLASTNMSNTTTAGAGLVFDPRLIKVRDVGNDNLTPSETSNISEGLLHSTDGLVENKPRVLDNCSTPSARPHRTGRRASYGDVSDLRKNVDFAVEESSRPKKSKKRLSFSSLSKAFNDSLASLLSNGSKSQGDGIDEDDEEDDDEHIDNSPVLKFSTLEIREYDTQLDTNPSVSCGPAMALSWSYNVSARVTVEKYEEHRPPRRKMREMRVPASEREFRLRMSGVSRKEIEESIKCIEKARKKRRKAIQQMKNDTMHEKLEGARRKLLKLLGRKKSQKQKEKELWENAQYYFAANTT